MKENKHCLRQVHTSNGINKHRAWECLNCGITVTSNDDVLGTKKFHLGNGETNTTEWFDSARAAINSVLCI